MTSPIQTRGALPKAHVRLIGKRPVDRSKQRLATVALEASAISIALVGAKDAFNSTDVRISEEHVESELVVQ